MSSLKTIAKTGAIFLRTYSPAILTGLAAAGVVSTTVLAVRVTPEAYRRIQDAGSEFDRDITLFEKTRLTWDLYLPAAISGVLTTTCIITAHTVSSRRQAAVASLLTVADTTLREYQTKVVETIGKNKETKLRDDIIGDRIDKNPPPQSGVGQVVVNQGGRQLCYDSFSDRYFYSDMQTIRSAMNDVNSTCNNQGSASQNDFYRKIGLDNLEYGEDFGYNVEHPMDIHFTSRLNSDGVACLAISYNKRPEPNYWRMG